MLAATLQGAFPRRLNESVREAVSVLMPSRHAPTEPREVRLGEERLLIPYRIYNDVALGKVVVGPENSAVLACILTRHHNGFVRQRNAAKLYVEPFDWVVPFVLLLVGEYVSEILSDIERAIPSMDLQTYRRVIAQNHALWETTQRRVTSYWDVYYRRQFPRRDDYVGFRVLSALGGGSRGVAL